ncbi:MAG: hypothetical protein ACRDPA_20910 [Solirubrobacteraceae bacterium]
MTSAPLPRRRATLTLAGLIALASMIVVLAAVGTRESHAAGDHAHGAAPVATLTAKAVRFHDAMRALWEIHGTYTERAIVDAVAGNPDTNAVVARLLQNQLDIGNAVKPYYGNAGGAALTKLLKTHINTAVATVLAAKSGNAAATQKAKAAFYANGKQVASFLHKANPKFWSLPAMQTMMRVHLNQVVALAVDQINGQYGAAIKLYDQYINHILVGMADMLSNGIIEQFPNRFQ